MVKIFGIYFSVIIFLSGCSSTVPKPQSGNAAVPRESRQEVQSAVESVIGAVSGKEMSPEEMKKLTRQLRQDKEAQSALTTIADSLKHPQKHIKYCPVDGKRYGIKMKTCPEHQVLLKELEE